MHIVKTYVMPILMGVMIAAAGLYMVMHQSTCRYEEVC